MSHSDDDFDAMLADQGDDRPGLDEIDFNDYSTLLGDDSDDDYDDDLDDDDEDLDEDLDDEDDDDYPDDATEDDIDFVIALYREDGEPAGLALAPDLANDLDELITVVRRIPGDAGAIGAVALAGECFVLVRVRGKKIEVLLSDALAAHDWPIARDVADFLGEEIPEDDDEADSMPIGDLDMLVDAGLSEIEMQTICEDFDSDADELVGLIAKKLGFAGAFKTAVAEFES